MRPLPSPPVSALLSVKSSDSSSWWPQDSSTYTPPSTAQSFAVRLPIGVNFPTNAVGGAPRPLKARRREGRIFTHSASSSMSSFDSASTASCSIKSAEFWMPPDTIVTIPMQAAYLTVTPSEEETKVMPHTPPTPKTKPKSKPAHIIIPRNTASTTVVSPTSPKPPLLSTAVPFPTNAPEAVTIPCTPRTPLSPFSPFTPNRHIQSPNARIRKLAKLTRTLGENVPVELVFPSGTSPSAPTNVAPASQPKATKRGKALLAGMLPQRVSPSGPRLTARPRPSAVPEWPLTPTPDCTINTEAHTQTAVGLHYALGMNSFPTRAVTVSPAAPALPSSPPPFSNVFTLDDVQWERARQAVMGTRAKKARHVVGGVRKPAEANGRGTWRKKENTWSGEWNVEDMEVLLIQLRRLK
ncbi:hypothetical protein C8R44DRAFT_877880 [Mycena epipterygia]|nr:hypothetical protein C8R44DRAFT_877880 [Mycena epipterygia]